MVRMRNSSFTQQILGVRYVLGPELGLHLKTIILLPKSASGSSVQFLERRWGRDVKRKSRAGGGERPAPRPVFQQTLSLLLRFPHPQAPPPHTGRPLCHVLTSVTQASVFLLEHLS